VEGLAGAAALILITGEPLAHYVTRVVIGIACLGGVFAFIIR
jgi:hypothetical protein